MKKQCWQCCHFESDSGLQRTGLCSSHDVKNGIKNMGVPLGGWIRVHAEGFAYDCKGYKLSMDKRVHTELMFQSGDNPTHYRKTIQSLQTDML